MRRPRPTAALAALAVATLALLGAGCSSSDEEAGPTTTTEATTTEATTTTAPATVTTAAGGTTDGLPTCQELLQEYADVFTPDDLQPVVERFRAWAPSMPDDVAAAVTRIADAYEAAGNLGELDMADASLADDAQTFSDWTAAGCPAP